MPQRAKKKRGDGDVDESDDDDGDGDLDNELDFTKNSGRSCNRAGCTIEATVQCITCQRWACELHTILCGQILNGEFLFACAAIHHTKDTGQLEELLKTNLKGLSNSVVYMLLVRLSD